MFTKRTYQALNFYFGLTVYVSALPLSWEPELRKLYPCKKTALLRYVLLLCWLTAAAGNATVSFFRGLGTQDYVRIAFDFLFFQGYAVLLVMSAGNGFKRKEYSAFYTMFLRYNSKYTETLFKTLHPLKGDGCQELLWSLINANIMFCFVVPVFFIILPEHPRYLYHRLPPEWKTWTTFLIALCLENYSYLALCMTFLLYFTIICTTTLGFNFWLGILLELRGEKAKKGLEYDQGLARRKEYELVGGLRILNIMANETLSGHVWPGFVMLLLVFQAYGIYSTVKLQGLVHPLIYLIFPAITLSCLTCLVAVFPVVGTMNYLSKEYIRVRVQGARSAWEGKWVKSLRPMGARVGSVYTITRTTWLTMVLIVTNLTVNAILMH